MGETDTLIVQAPPQPTASSLRMILTMGAIGTLAAILLVLTYFGTLPAIERNRAQALERAIFDVLPGASAKQTFVDSGGTLAPDSDSAEEGQRYHAGYDHQGALVGVAIQSQGQGFQDVLKVLYGYDPHCGCVVGFKVLESKETPGLGDKIETDPAFVANFEALDVSLDATGTIAHPLELAKPGQKNDPWQVEGITGATISCRAVTRILRESIAGAAVTINQNMEELERGQDGNRDSDH